MSTACKTRSCWGKAHDLCKGDWFAETGTLFRCICDCHGPDRLTPVTAGADWEQDYAKDIGDGGMGSGDWMKRHPEEYPHETEGETND